MTCVKYLGVLLLTDSRVDWLSHVQLIKRKLLYAYNMFFKVTKFVPIDILRLLYFSFDHYHLQYCIILWATSNNSVVQPLSVLQNNILQIMTVSKYKCHHRKLPEIYKKNLRNFFCSFLSNQIC